MKSTLHFNDEIRKIDFVMAYVEHQCDDENSQRRQVYESALIEKGLELEIEPKEVGYLYLIKLYQCFFYVY